MKTISFATPRAASGGFSKILKTSLFAGTALGLGGISAPALAQQGGSVESEDIVVTARRTEERLQDVPISIQVFNQEQISELNITDSTDLARYTPSLAADSRFGSENASFAIRGFRQEGQTSPSVGVYFNDVVAPRAQGGTGGGNNIAVGQLFDLQNVQVLRGPQGTLFGRNTTGGAVLVVPQRPTHELGGYAEVSGGNHNMLRYQGVFNTPVGDQARLRVGFDRQTRDGYVTNHGEGPSDFGDVDYWSARAGFAVDLTPNLENYSLVTYSNSTTNGPIPPRMAACDITQGALAALACLQIAGAEARGDGFYDVEQTILDPHSDTQQWGLYNTTTWALSDSITIKNIFSWQEYTQNTAYSLFGENFGAIFGETNFNFLNLYPEPGTNNAAQQTFTEEIQLQGETEHLTYQLGFYYEKASPVGGFQASVVPAGAVCQDPQNYICNSPLNPPNAPLSNSRSKYEFENIGIYAQGTYDISDQLALTMGIRYTMDEVTATNDNRTFFPAGTDINGDGIGGNAPGEFPANFMLSCDVTQGFRPCFTANESWEEPTYLVNLDWTPTEDLLLYAKYARGYRQGNINVSFRVPFSWDPEFVNAYEVGLKSTFDGPVRGNLNLALFYNDFSDQQLAANLHPDGSIIGLTETQTVVNAGESVIQGLEVNSTLHLFDGFSVDLAYTYLNTELKSYSTPIFPGYDPATVSSLVGESLAFSPEHKLTLTPSYTLPLDPAIGEITLSATYTYQSEQTFQSDSILGFADELSLLNLNADWEHVMGSNIDLGLFGSNVTDEEYPIGVGGIWPSLGFDGVIPGQPQMYGVRLRYSFGGES